MLAASKAAVLLATWVAGPVPGTSRGKGGKAIPTGLQSLPSTLLGCCLQWMVWAGCPETTPFCRVELWTAGLGVLVLTVEDAELLQALLLLLLPSAYPTIQGG